MLLLALFISILRLSSVSSTGISVELYRNEKDRVPNAIIKSNTAGNVGETNKVEFTCSSGGCNKTDNKANSEKTDEIASDIVVQIRTTAEEDSKVNSTATAKKEEEDEIADVPVVIGYGGTSNDQGPFMNPNENSINPINPNAISVSNLEHSFSEVNHDVKNGGFIPISGPTIEIRPLVPSNENNRRYIYNTGPAGPYYRRPESPIWRNNGLNERRNYWWYPNPNQNRRTEFIRPTPSTWTSPCSCNPNNMWTPTPPYVSLNQPGKQINDKLMPLN